MIWQEWCLLSSVLIVPFLYVVFKRRDMRLSCDRIYFLDILMKWSLIFMLVSVPVAIDIRTYPMGEVKLPFFQIPVFTILLAWIGRSAEQRSSGAGMARIYFPAVVFLAVSIASFFVSSFKYASVKELYSLFCCIILFMYVAGSANDTRQARAVLNAALMSGVAVSAYGILQFFGIDFLPWEGNDRPISFLGNPNFLSGYLVALIPLCLGMIFSALSGRSRALYCSILVLLFTCLVLTLTRTSLIAAFLGMVIFFALRFRRRNRLKEKGGAVVLVAAVLVIAIAACGLVFVPALRTRIRSIAPAVVSIAGEIPGFLLKPGEFRTKSKENVAVRITLWQTAYRMFLDRPLLGFGIGTLPYNAYAYRPSFYKIMRFEKANIVEHAHSEYLELLAEEGIAGFAAFCWFILSFFRYIKKGGGLLDSPEYSIVLGCAVSVFSLLFEGIASVSLRQVPVAVLFWLSLGLAVSVTRSVKAKAEGCGRPQAEACALGRVKKRYVYAMIIAAGIFFWNGVMRSFSSNLHYGRAEIFRMNGDFAPAIEECRLALYGDPAKIAVFYHMGYYYGISARLGEAERSYLETIRLCPHYCEVDYNLGLVYYRQNRFDEALACFKNAIKLDEYKYDSYYMMGLCYVEKGDYLSAAGSMESAISRRKELTSAWAFNPFFPEALYNLGGIYYYLGRYRDAAEQYREILRTLPCDRDALAMLDRLKHKKY